MSSPAEGAEMVGVPADLQEAIDTLHRESVGDFTYDIRDREGLGWEGPRVKAWSDAASVIRKYARPAPDLEPCGHSRSEIVSSDEGTSHCAACEREAQ